MKLPLLLPKPPKVKHYGPISSYSGGFIIFISNAACIVRNKGNFPITQ
jgi:hypothetical protein